MRYVWLGASAVLLISVLTIILGSARPFEQLAEDNPAYTHLLILEEEELLKGLSLPAEELSRLESAVLTQHGLAEYGALLLSGDPISTRSEQALTWLLTEFADELALIGAPTAFPQPLTVQAYGLERRVSHLEEEFDEAEEYDWNQNETYLDQLYPCDCSDCSQETPLTATSLYGDFYLQGRFDTTSYTGMEADYEHSDLKLYWGELGVDATDDTWSGHFSVLFDDETDEAVAYEYYGRFCSPDTGWFLQAGKIELPWSNNFSYFPTYAATYDLGRTVVPAVGFGLDKPDWGFNGWLFNPDIEVGDEEDHFTDYAVIWDITRRRADACQSGWALTAGYISHIAAHELHLGGKDSVVDRNGAVNVFARYDWGGNRYHLIADFTHTLDEFNPADLDSDGDAIGDQPCALNAEFVYEPHPDRLWGLSLQKTCELADYAETRFGLLYGKRLSELAMLKLEYTHGEYGDFVTAAQDADDTIVAELNLAF